MSLDIALRNCGENCSVTCEVSLNIASVKTIAYNGRMHWLTETRHAKILDPILWIVIVLGMIVFHAPLTWLLLIVPIWIGVRIWQIASRGA